MLKSDLLCIRPEEFHCRRDDDGKSVFDCFKTSLKYLPNRALKFVGAEAENKLVHGMILE